MSSEIYNSEELAKFKKVQRIAYEAVCKVSQRLEPGITEKQAASMIAEELKKEGVRRYFHRPFAWFGDRTKFANFKKIGTLSFWKLFGLPHFGKQFQPCDRRLAEGMPVILDVAPTIDGYAADVGYATWCGTNSEVNQARMDLRKYRSLILKGVRNGSYLSTIYEDVDLAIARDGYTNVHSYYPGSVLGHKVGRLPLMRLPAMTVLGFDMQSLLYLGRQQIKGIFSSEDPLWGPDSHFRAEPGLWAVEPHIGTSDGIGVKWEEILVVTENDAYWLDDDLPHVKYWQGEEWKRTA